MKNRKIALVTGASSGIGKATVEELVKLGFNVVACARRKKRLDELIDRYGDDLIYPLIFDVSDRQAVRVEISSLPPEWQSISVLVNNAGNAHGLSTIQEGSVDDWDAMIDSNVKGLLYVSKEVLPLMRKAENPIIVNLGSIAGVETYPKGNVYCATKHAVHALSDAMRIDLNKESIRVCEIQPGAVQTEFSEVRFKGDVEKAQHVYEGYTPLSAPDVAELIGFVVTRPKHVNIATSLILPSAQASATVWNKS